MLSSNKLEMSIRCIIKMVSINLNNQLCILVCLCDCNNVLRLEQAWTFNFRE